MDWLYSLVMGLVEGLTEFLPVSSTGHLIVTAELFQRKDATFEIAIQFGAISAILFLYRRRLWNALRHLGRGADENQRVRVNLWWLIFAAALPAALVGLWLDDHID